MNRILRICENCFDFDKANNVCLVRYTILKDKTRIPMKRRANQHDCKVFMYS